MGGSFVVLTGASGVGKTTIALAIEARYPECVVFRFDTIGVPSAEVMASYGSGHQPGGAWQRAMTLEWMERIAPAVKAGRSVLFEGQMRPAFLAEALAAQGLEGARVVLVECGDATREWRLTEERGQPELANEGMAGWARYLHGEAMEAGYEVLDTELQSLGESVASVASCLGLTVEGA